jgi:uncharacterized membrane protein
MSTKVEKTITVDVPVNMAYNQWTQFEEFPQFMGGVQKVEQLDDRRLHWVAEIAGVKREWYAEILEQRADEKIAWAATEGATNAGAVYFTPEGADRTQIRLELEYEPEGLIEKAGDALNIIDRQAQSDVEKFKTFIEARSLETGGWRGEVEGQTLGTPGVEDATSQGDSGKTGISGKAAAAGIAAVAGAAAVAASRSGSSEDTSQADTSQTEAVDVVEVETVTPPVTGEVIIVDETPEMNANPAVSPPEDEISLGDPVADPDVDPGIGGNRDGR